MIFKPIIKKAAFFFRELRYSSHFCHFGRSRILGKIICKGKGINLGDNCTINHGTFLNAKEEIRIGDYCRISPYVQIHTGGLNLNQHYSRRSHFFKKIVIEKGVWICAGAIICPGVTIGEGSVIAPGSVVSKDVPPFELWGGVPAKKIKDLPKKSGQEIQDN